MLYVNRGEAEAGKHNQGRSKYGRQKGEVANKHPEKQYVPQFLSFYLKKNGV